MDDNEPTLPATTPTGYSGKPSDPALCPGTPKSKSQPLDVSSDEEEIGMIPHPSASSTQRFAHFVLHNFFIATPLIFLIIFVPFFAVAWFTVLQDAQSMSVQTPSNPTGVSARLNFALCDYKLKIANGRCRGRRLYSVAFAKWTWIEEYYPFHGKPSTAVRTLFLRIHSGVFAAPPNANRSRSQLMFTSTSTSRFLPMSNTGVSIHLSVTHP